MTKRTMTTAMLLATAVLGVVLIATPPARAEESPGKAAQDAPPQITGKSFPVAKATFHRYENLRSGRIKTARGWNAADFAVSVYNPGTKPIYVTWTLIADDPEFIYRNGRKGTWTKAWRLEPDSGKTDNVYSGACPGAPWPVLVDSNWTGKTEFKSDSPFYAYILSFPDVEGPDASKAAKKGEMVWSDAVQGPWDEDRKQFVFPYTNYWKNDPYWLGGWHSRLILVNRSEAPITYKVSHKPYYWKSVPVPDKKEQCVEFKLASGETKDVWLEDLFGWREISPSAMEGRLCITPIPPNAWEKTDARLYILPDKVTLESLKKKEKQALSDDTGIVVKPAQSR